MAAPKAIRRTAALLILALAAVMLAGCGSARAIPAVTTAKVTTAQLAPRGLMVQGNDLANLNSLGTSYTADFKWITCAGNSGPCAPGDITSYTSEAVFRAAVASGVQAAGSTALLDLEPWDLTPAAESAHIEYYDKLAGLLARASGITLIESPVDYVDGLPEAAEAAAPYAGIAEIQSQGHDASPAELYAYVHPIVEAIRKLSKTVPIMIGLATDAGGWDLVSGATLYADYLRTYGLATYFWLNMHAWPGRKGCAPQGCPADGAVFVQDVTS